MNSSLLYIALFPKGGGGGEEKEPAIYIHTVCMHIIIAMEFCVRIINGNDTLLPT